MARHDKLYQQLLLQRSDANVSFDGLCALLDRLGFSERIRGDHHIFTMDGIDEILNLQPRNAKGKPYQVKQVREVILRYNLRATE
uniref:YcfA-like protein n=1 Tax=Candidatus Kentrum sp. UNK TaxID=2126344 RepID=A0A451AXA9_9GAMM|nr:MAG: YcfA-like protein [Candidatus Kentron sp. UNK]VFK70681.1 MAG: YcfA-like protein [Candidatus Kentron sp. UNK]